MRRVLVVGRGFFGGLVAARLRELGLSPVVVARRFAVRMDAEDEASLREVLRRDDVIVDTAGPFAARTTRLVRAAIATGCDVIDLAESLAWSEAMLALADDARSAGVRLYPACSAVAAVAGACVVASHLDPTSVDMFLAPASAETASPATLRAFLASVGTPIRTYRDGGLQRRVGFTESRPFPAERKGHAALRSRYTGGLVESAAALLMPRSWPGLLRAEFWVDPNATFARRALSFAAHVPPVAPVVRRVSESLPFVPFGKHDGVFAVTTHAGPRSSSMVLSAARGSYRIAVEPAVIAAESLARGASPEPGVVLPHAQVDPEMLFARLRELGISVEVRS